MHSRTRRGSSGLAGSCSELLAVLLSLTASRLSHAQPAERDPQAANPAPTTAASLGIAPNDYPYPPALDAPAPAPPAIALAKAVPVASTRLSYGAVLSSSGESETGSTSVVLSPLLEGAYAVHPNVLLDLAWGFGWLVDNQGLGESTFRAGNPQFTSYFHADTGPWRFRAGAGVTAPLAHVPLSPDGRLYNFLYNQTMAMWGMWNLWLWSPDRMALPSMFRVSYTLSGGLAFSFEEASAVVFGVRGNATGTESLQQVALEVEFPIGQSFVLRPRFQTVLMPSTSVNRFQSSAVLRGTLQTKAGRFFAGLLINLDEPLGGAAGLERWGFHLGKEIEL